MVSLLYKFCSPLPHSNNELSRPDVIALACSPNPWKAEAGESLELNLGNTGRPCLKRQRNSWVLVAHACNPSYSRGKDQEDHI
jgi:hypothetical protein